jgi:pimeloyl-ACP methyl ester carboxylesterase
MTLFVLVHGAWHGAWCWSRVIPMIEERGHAAVAMDLPIEDRSAGWSNYADAVIAAMGDADGDIVLVGHSMGGHVIPVVAERHPVTRSVFLAAGMPVEDSFAELIAKHVDHFGPALADKLVWAEDGGTSWRPDDAAEVFYNDCDSQDARDAVSRLRTQYMQHAAETFPIRSFPNSPSTYIVCSQDRAISPAWGRRITAELGMDSIEIDASRSPFWSRPSELADVLVSLA